MTRYGTQFRLVAQGLVDYLAGIDPSAVGLEIIEVLASSKVTHLRYAVKKKR